MKRRSFLKTAAAAGAATILSPGLAGLTASSCAKDPAAGPATSDWNFDEIIDRSGTWSIKYRRAEGDKLAMWIADMDFRTDPIVREALRQRLETVMGYTFTPDEYYEAVAGWLRTQHGFAVERAWLSTCPGVITSINQTYLTFTKPGDKIIIQPPVYDHFRLYIERLGRVPVENPLLWKEDHYEMDFEGLERLYDSNVKALVLCNPHNPVGITWPRETLASLADWCAQHDVLVISDEIHADLALFGHEYTPFCSASETAARVGMIFSGPTKSFNLAGLSGTAWCVIPDPVKRAQYQAALQAAKLNEAAVPSLVATIAAYTHEPLWLNDLKKYLEGNITCLEERLKASPETRGIRAVRPQASFLLWLDCRELGLPQEELMALFNETAGVVVNNGASYGTGGAGFVRLNIGCPRSVVEEALDRIARAVAALKR